MPPPLPPEKIAPNDGESQLNGRLSRVPMKIGEQRNREMFQFLVEKSKTVDTPIVVKPFLREFKEKSGCTDSVKALENRYQRVRKTIYQSTGIDENTKIKMMFISNAKLSDEILKELREDADVEIDEEGRITKYKSKDGSLELEGSHGQSDIMKSVFSNRWQTIYQKASKNESDEDEDGDTNCQKDNEKKRIELVRFLIERTKHATSPLSIKKLVKNYRAEIKSSEPISSIESWIQRFRQRICDANQFDTATKVKMLFALSATIDAKLLKALQKDAIVELDVNQRIKKYKANDGSLDLEGDHSGWAKRRLGKARNTKALIVNNSSESEDDENEEDSIETDGSEREEASTSLSARRSDRLRKSRVSLQNKNKKRQLPEKNSDFIHTRNHARTSRGKKRARISSSSSETSEDLEESLTLENDPSMDSETNNLDNFGDDFDYDLPANNHYNENLEHNVTNPNSERDIATPEVRDEMEEEEKKEESSASSSAEIESMSLLELLNHLRSPIAQYTPNLVPKIDENIEKLDEKDKQIPFNIIIESLEMCIQILNTPDEMDSDENTTSLSNFYYHLGMAMCNITHSSMDDFHVKMRKLATTGDENASVEHIQYAMRETLDKILN